MKKDLRREILGKRLLIPAREAQIGSSRIMETLLSLDCIKNARCVMVFYSHKNEPNLLPLMHTLLEMGKKVALPYISDDDELVAVDYLEDSLMKSNVFGIPEPVISSESEQAEPDVILVPGVVFDESGNRIGYGLGYFDRYLKHSTALKIGICFDMQITEHIEAKAHDVRMDMLVTESRVITACG